MRQLLPRGRKAAALLLSLGAMLYSQGATTKSGALAKRHTVLKLEQVLHLPLRHPEPLSALGRLDSELVAIGAMSMLGTEYQLGARSSHAVDCSLLVQRIYRSIGLELPRTTREQMRHGRPVEASELQKGDLLFYRWQARNLHVAIYLDDGYILHASPKEGRVVITQINPSWRNRLVAARRLL